MSSTINQTERQGRTGRVWRYPDAGMAHDGEAAAKNVRIAALRNAISLLIPGVVAKRTVDARLILPVAVHASTHRRIHFLRDYVPFRNRAVTGLAIRPRLLMDPVAKKHITWNLIHTNPRHQLLILCVSSQLLNSRALRLDRGMAAHASLCHRVSHHLARIRVCVAVLALQPQCEMGLMAVRNRLRRSQ